MLSKPLKPSRPHRDGVDIRRYICNASFGLFALVIGATHPNAELTTTTWAAPSDVVFRLLSRSAPLRWSSLRSRRCFGRWRGDGSGPDLFLERVVPGLLLSSRLFTASNTPGAVRGTNDRNQEANSGERD